MCQDLKLCFGKWDASPLFRDFLKIHLYMRFFHNANMSHLWRDLEAHISHITKTTKPSSFLDRETTFIHTC